MPKNVVGQADHLDPEYEVVDAKAVEPKTKAATVGAGAGSVVTGFVLFLLDAWLWNGEADPPVPLPVVLFVGLAVTGTGAFVAGYYTRHVNRRA